MDRPALLSALRARIARLDRSAGAASGSAAGGDGIPQGIPQGIPLCDAVDSALPGGGLSRAAVHEVLAAEPGAAAGFCALVLARAAGTVLWIAAEPDAWPPGLARFGLSPANLVLVQAPRPVDGLWAMEEALRCPAVSGALLVLSGLDLTAARRLQLAAEAGGGVGLLLRPDTEEAASDASAALTRWRVGALAGTGGGPIGGGGLGDPRWQLDLLRCRGGRPGSWRVVWRGTADQLDLDTDDAEAAEPPVARPARTAAARRR
jgi:protein ImuA